MHDYSKLSKKQTAILLISILIVALCGLAYELIIATVSSYLLGNSVYQFSLTIGFFMFSMGVGSYLSQLLGKNLIQNFISIEIAIAFVGGISSLLLFMAFPMVGALYDCHHVHPAIPYRHFSRYGNPYSCPYSGTKTN